MNLTAVIWALIFFFLPFERFIKIPGTDLTWNAVHILFWIAIIFLYAHHWFSDSKKISGIKTAGILTLILLFIFTVGHATVESAQRLFFILASIWSAPLLFVFIKEQRVLATNIFIMSLALHAIWGVAQFSFQADLNLDFLGETNVLIGQPGLATFTDTTGSKLIRAYGPYPHPNILAGSLIFALIALTTFESGIKRIIKNIYLPIWYLLSLGVLFTFSRAAWLAYIILFLVSCRTLTGSVRNLILISTLIISVPLIMSRSTDTHDVALTERFSSATIAGTLLFNQPFLKGVGPGNYEHTLEMHLREQNISYDPWDIAPVHNVPLLLAVEWGLVFTSMLIVVALWRYTNYFHATWLYLLPVIPLLLFDHYLVSQPAPLLCLVVVVLLLAESGSVQPRQKSASAPPPATIPTPPTPQ